MRFLRPWAFYGWFTRRIVRNRDKTSLDAIRGNYEDDIAFREHVDRYLEQASESDPEDILVAVRCPQTLVICTCSCSRPWGALIKP